MKKPIIVVIIILAIMGMIIPTTSAGFTNYIFKEDFDGTTLDNSTWVNQSSPFPYEMKDGRIIVHFDPNPEKRYSATDPIHVNIDRIHGEIDFSIYTPRYQANSSYSHAFVGIIFTKNRTADPVPPLGYDKGVWADITASNNRHTGGRYVYGLRIGSDEITRTEGHEFTNENYGIETSLKFVFDAYIQDNDTMLVNEQYYKDGKLILAHNDYIDSFDPYMVIFFSTEKSSTGITPVDGYIAIESIQIGQYSPEQETTASPTIYEYFMTVSIIMLLISGTFFLFYDKAPIIDITAVVSFYMALGLLSLFFLTYPEMIFGIPAWLYATLPAITILAGIVKAEKLSMFG